jgi:hypothetical protein
MDISEILDRLEALARDMHHDVNGEHKATSAELKQFIRDYRDEIRQIVAEAGR